MECLSFGEEAVDGYPIKTEKELILSIAEFDKPRAQRHLNELLGHIFFSSGSDFTRVKTRIFELLVVMSRAAVDSGIPADETFRINHRFLQLTQSMVTPDEIYLPITDIMNQYIDDLFDYSTFKNAEICQKAIQFVDKNYSKKITVDDVARAVYLSPSYFSKLFKKEMRCGFNTYLNQVRIKRSTHFLLYQNIRMNDIAGLVGFDDQSYFTKVFKKVVGVLPSHYRNSKGML